MTVEAKTAAAIVGEIDAHIVQSNIPITAWYVGITSDINQRLFGDHNVPGKDHWYIYRKAFNDSEARAIEARYHKLGCKGAGGGGDHNTIYVYAYEITPVTVE